MATIPTLQAIIAAQCLLFFLFLTTTGRLAFVANRVMAAILLTLGAQMALNLASSNLGNIASALMIALGFLYGPLFFAYSKTLAQQEKPTVIFYLRHLAVAPAVLIGALVAHIPAVLFAVGIFGSLAAYGLAMHRLLLEYRRVLGATRAGAERLSLYWLIRLLWIMVGLLILNISAVLLLNAGYPVLGFFFEAALYAGLLFLVTFIIFNGLEHPDLFSGIDAEDTAIARQAEAPTPELDPQEARDLFDRIEQLMAEKHLYLTPGLTVKSVGHQLVQPPRKVSLAINGLAGRNFSDYVNRWRINHACALLTDPERADLSVMDILLESGFNTKSAFNRCFKDVTGTTPAAYRKAHGAQNGE